MVKIISLNSRSDAEDYSQIVIEQITIASNETSETVIQREAANEKVSFLSFLISISLKNFRFYRRNRRFPFHPRHHPSCSQTPWTVTRRANPIKILQPYESNISHFHQSQFKTWTAFSFAAPTQKCSLRKPSRRQLGRFRCNVSRRQTSNIYRRRRIWLRNWRCQRTLPVSRKLNPNVPSWTELHRLRYIQITDSLLCKHLLTRYEFLFKEAFLRITKRHKVRKNHALFKHLN